MSSERETLIEQLYEERPWLRVQANTPLISATVQGGWDLLPWSIESLREAADRLQRKDQLAFVSEYADAWREFLRRRPEFDMRGNRDVCFASVNPWDVSADAFEQLADRENSPLSLTEQAYEDIATQAAQEQSIRDEQAERQRLREEITAGRSQFTMRDKYRRKHVYSSETGNELQYSANPRRQPEPNWFETVDLPTLRAVHAQIMEERRLEGLDYGGLRKASNPEGKYDQKSVSEFRTHTVQNQRPAPQAQATQDDNYVLKHPDTLVPFTKETVTRYMNTGNVDTDRDNARRLLVQNGRVNKQAETALLRLLGKIK